MPASVEKVNYYFAVRGLGTAGRLSQNLKKSESLLSRDAVIQAATVVRGAGRADRHF
jgi:hypothetical protein